MPSPADSLTITRPSAARLTNVPAAAAGPATPRTFRPDQRLATVPATAMPAPAKKPDVVVPGEGLRTILCFTSMAISPLIQATQTLGMLAKTTFANPLLAKGVGLVLGTAEVLTRSPLVNNPVTRGALRAAGVALPFVNAGILAFDGYSAWQTLRNPEASRLRKGLTIARLAANALATALCFVPGSGAVLSMPPAWLSIGLDLYIKRLNAKGVA